MLLLPAPGPATAGPFFSILYSPLCCQRWVRNELDGTLLIVKHTPDSPNGAPGGTQVMFLEHLSSTRRLRLYFHCDTAIFKQGRILDSVRACVTNTEARHCPICMQAPGANCSCKLVLIPPNFAFDYHGCAAAMQSQSGSYLGQAGITISLRKKLPPDAPPAARMDPNRPRRYVSAPLISSLETTSFCRSRCDATHDALAELLLNFAVQTSLKEANPSRTALPVPATRADDDDEEEDDGGDGDVVVAPETPSFSPGSARDAAGDTTAGSSAASVGSMGHLTDDEMLSFPAPPFAQSTDGEGGTAAALSSIMSDTPGSAAMDMTSSTDFVASCLLLDDYKPLEPLSLANASGADGEPFATIGGLEDLALNAAPSGQSPPVGAAAATEVTPSDASSVDASTESQQQFRRQQKARGVTDEELAAREARRKKKVCFEFLLLLFNWPPWFSFRSISCVLHVLALCINVSFFFFVDVILTSWSLTFRFRFLCSTMAASLLKLLARCEESRVCCKG